MELQTVPIRRAGNRHSLWMGGDRELVMFSGLLAFALIFAAQSWVAAFFGVALWFGAVFILRLMAKSDPQMRNVYLSNRKYATYYPARSTPFRNNTKDYK